MIDHVSLGVSDPDGHRIEAVCHLPGETLG
jgi:hypothetical protein